MSTPDTKSQYQILFQIKVIDEQVAKLQIEAERIPEQIVRAEGHLNTAKASRDSAKEKYTEYEKGVRKAELDLKEKEDYIRKAESKMMEVKTNDEYRAAMKELQVHKDEKSAIEDKALVLLNDIEKHRQELKVKETEFQGVEKEVLSEIKLLQGQQAKVTSELMGAKEKRTSVAKGLSADALELYEKVTTRIQGITVVAVENGKCMGCNMQIPPQRFNEILGFKSIHRCPSCGRILVHVNSNVDEAAP